MARAAHSMGPRNSRRRISMSAGLPQRTGASHGIARIDSHMKTILSLATNTITNPLRRSAWMALLAGFASPVLCQVPLTGALSDQTTGPLQSGVVYHVTGNIVVSPGATLTVQPGAILKFQLGRYLQIYG